MNAPYLEIDLSKLHSNTKKLLPIFEAKGIGVTGVTKSFLGDPQIANCFVSAGISSLGDSRIENIIRMRKANVRASLSLIRTPSAKDAHDVVRYANVSFNTELSVIAELSKAALKQNKIHEIVLMVEMGDLREGILRQDLATTIEKVLRMKGVRLIGLGTNMTCLSGVKPTKYNMDMFSRLVDIHEKNCGTTLHLISGGNSSNIDWMLETEDVGRVNNIRIGEAILLGRETLY